MNKKNDVAIVMINYKTAELVKSAVQSIFDNTKKCSFEVIIVDNSNDELEYAKLADSLKGYEVKIVDPKGNIGFGAGNNYGSKFANSDYLLFLNSDTLLRNDAISIMHKFISSHHDVGVVGPNLFKANGDKNNSYERNEKNLKFDCSNYLYSYFRRKHGKNLYFNSSKSPLEINGYICGASLMIKRSIFEELGGFDEDIFMYAEDSLLCYRVRKEKKLKIYNIPDSEITHLEGASFDKVSATRAKYIAHGNYIYYKKCFGDKTATKYLKKTIAKFKQKRFLCRLFKKTSEIANLNNLIASYKLELQAKLLSK